jgi:hypothetical protein
VPPLLDFSLSIVQATGNTIVSIITTAGMAYGVQSIVKKKSQEN